MHISLFFRKPAVSFFSIENLFKAIAGAYKETDIKVVHMPFKSALNPFALIRNMFYAYKNQGEVNHITGDIYYASLALEGNKTIITIHDLESLRSSNWIKRSLLQLFWLKLPVQKVKYVTVISEHTKRKLLKATGVPEKKVVVIPNCIAFVPEDFKPKAELSGDTPVLLQIGTKQNKNLENLVLALEGITCKLHVIGYLSESQRQLLEAKHINYENYWQLTDDEVKALYYKSDVVMFVSTYEGFGLPILEANAYGRPVITANVTAMPEVAGNSALLVNPDDPGQIRDAIEKLINDAELRNTLVTRGYKNVQRFKPEFVATQYENLYKRVISENVKH